jgi:ankyrin repeat protein
VGDWFLQSQEYNEWVFRRQKYLHLYGEHGCGKTYLASIIVDRLEKEQEDADGADCKVFYLPLDIEHEDCPSQKDRPINLTKEFIIGDLLKQLFQKSEAKLLSISQIYETRKRLHRPLKWEEACRIWREEIKRFNKVYLIIDALDRMPTSIATEILNELCTKCPDNTSVLITSRDFDFGKPSKANICSHCRANKGAFVISCFTCNARSNTLTFCESCRPLMSSCQDVSHELCRVHIPVDVYVSPPSSDIIRYIEKTFAHIGLPEGEEQTIIEQSALRAGDNFILAKLHMDAFPNYDKKSNVQRVFQEFPEPVRAFYQGLITKITEQTRQSDRELGLKVIYLIANTKDLLTVLELRHLLAIEPRKKELNEAELYPPQKLRPVAAFMISIDEIDNGRSTVELRDNVRTFFQGFNFEKEYDMMRTDDSNPPDVTLLCLTYLNYNIFDKPCKGSEELEDRLEQYPFAKYAAHFWGEHLRDSLLSDTGHLYTQKLDLAMKLLQDEQRLASCTQIAWYKNRFADEGLDVRKGLSGLHMCAWHGLSSLIENLVSTTVAGVDVRDKTYGQTPLMYACRRGHADTARKLLECGADINLISARGRFPIHEAVDPQLHTEKTAGEMMSSSTASDSNDDDLHLDTLMVLLNQPEVNVNSTDPQYFGRTPLMLAVQLHKLETVQALTVHPNIDINYQDSYGSTALWLASKPGFEAIARILIERPQINVSVPDFAVHRTALLVAAEEGNSDVVSLLLANGADTKARDTQGGSTASLHAASRGHLLVLTALLQHDQKHGVRIDDCNDVGQGLLHVAASNDQTDIIDILSSYGFDANAKDLFGMTPLHHACRTDSCAAIDALAIDLGADIEAKDYHGRTPYMVAYEYSNDDAQDTLCQIADEKGIALSSVDDNLPLWALAKRGDLDSMNQAMTSNAPGLLDPEPGFGHTVLHWAVKTKSLKILEWSLERDVVPADSTDFSGRTPLHIAAFIGDQEMILALLDKNASIDPLDKWGYTPLSRALMYRRLQAGVTLFEKGADVDLIRFVKQIKVQTLFFAAIGTGRTNAVKLLLDKGADILGRDPAGKVAMDLVPDEEGNSQLMRMLRSTSSFSYTEEPTMADVNGNSIDPSSITWHSGTAIWHALKRFAFQDGQPSDKAIQLEQPTEAIEMYRAFL